MKKKSNKKHVPRRQPQPAELVAAAPSEANIPTRVREAKADPWIERRARANTKAERQALFLEVYANVGNILTAAKETGINRCTHYEWIEEPDSDYGHRFKLAEDDFRDLVRESVRTRAVLGVSQDVYDGKGNYVGIRTMFSDRLLERLAEAKCPEFKRKTELTGPDGGPMKIEVVTGVPQPENA